MGKSGQRILKFRNGVATAGQLWYDIYVMQTGPNRYTVAKRVRRGDYALIGNAAYAAFSLLYNPFRTGFEYKLQEFIDYATSVAYNIVETSQEDPTPLIYWLDIGTTSNPTAGSITSSGATISWTNTNATKNTKINIYISSDGGATYTLKNTATASATSQAITGLTTATAYKVKVVPANDYGDSPTPANVVSFTTS